MSDSPMQSSAPQTVMLTDYKLALKLFMNKDFAQSFAIILRLHDAAYRNYERGLLSEDVFVKIATLYLTEVGLVLNPRESLGLAFALSRLKKRQLAQLLEQSTYLDSLHRIYGSLADVPLELLFQICLVYYTCQKAIRPDEPAFLPNMFRKVYHMIDFQHARTDDRHLKRWVDMFVFNVLPDADDFDTAFALADTNPLLDREKATTKLRELHELKRQEKRLREKSAKESEAREAKRVEAENARKRKEKEEKNLKYMSLKQIQKEHTLEATPVPDKPQKATVEYVRARVEHFLELSRNSISKNSPVILLVLVLAFVSTAFLRRRRINLRDKLRETLLMAFKVTYV